jgi:hypothetical protein
MSSEREANPLRENVELLRAALEAGESADAIAKEAQVDRTTVLRFAAGGKQRIVSIIAMHEFCEARRRALGR